MSNKNCDCRNNIPYILKPGELLVHKDTFAAAYLSGFVTTIGSMTYLSHIMNSLSDWSHQIYEVVSNNRLFACTIISSLSLYAGYHAHVYVTHKLNKNYALINYRTNEHHYDYAHKPTPEVDDMITLVMSPFAGFINGLIVSPLKFIKSSLSSFSNSFKDTIGDTLNNRLSID